MRNWHLGLSGILANWHLGRNECKGWFRKRGHLFFVAGGVFFGRCIAAADVLQRQMHCCWQVYLFAAVGGVKWPPPAAISRQKCGRRHFESAIRRENTAKPWQVDISFAFHPPRFQECSASATWMSSASVQKCSASVLKITDNPSGLPGAS